MDESSGDHLLYSITLKSEMFSGFNQLPLLYTRRDQHLRITASNKLVVESVTFRRNDVMTLLKLLIKDAWLYL